MCSPVLKTAWKGFVFCWVLIAVVSQVLVKGEENRTAVYENSNESQHALALQDEGPTAGRGNILMTHTSGDDGY